MGDDHIEQTLDQPQDEQPLAAELATSPEKQPIREGIAEALRHGSATDDETV